MSDFEKIILKDKKISIWGIGYLGYTTILRLQENGFLSTLYDFSKSRLSDLQKGLYPAKEQINSWSKNGKIPSLELEKIEIAEDKNLLFDNKIHIISFPNTKSSSYVSLAETFVKNRNKLENSLVIFQSAGVPEDIEKFFYVILKKHNINIKIATVFRSDWTIEDFFDKTSIRVISGNNQNAVNDVKVFLDFLGLEAIKLNSIVEAEIYENAKNALNYTVVAFFNQLSLAYPGINVNELSKKMFKDLKFDNNITLGVSGVDYKSEQSIENILRGSTKDFLTILKEANRTNISFLFYYIDLLKSKNIKSVTILGLSSYSTMKDLRFSPSVILSEYLYRENIEIYIHDENFNKEEILDVLPYCNFIDIYNDRILSDTVIIMSLCREYKFLTQDDIDKMDLSNVKYVLDNTGFFKNFIYSKRTIYHQLCDGNLSKVIY